MRFTHLTETNINDFEKLVYELHTNIIRFQTIYIQIVYELHTNIIRFETIYIHIAYEFHTNYNEFKRFERKFIF